jgi:sulfate permease, SulP family
VVVRRVLLGAVPPTLRSYQRSWLNADLIAGLTLAAIAVPAQMATAGLAGLPAVTGLYAFVAASVMFALLGANRHMAVGADSTIAPIFAAAVGTVVAVGTPRYAHLVAFLAIAVGLVVGAVGLLRLGWIADFLPTPAITGLLAGIAIEILARQLAAVLGVAGGGSTTVGRLRVVFDQRGHINAWAVMIAAAVLAIIVVSERVDRRVPGALIGVALSTGLVAWFGLEAHGVRILGSIHAGFPSIGVPSVRFDDVQHLVAAALTVAFLCVAQTAATVRSAGVDQGGLAAFDRDLVAVGAGNLLAGLSGSFAVNASPPQTAVVTASGGRSQVTSLTAAALAVAVIFTSGVLRDLPQAALGAILIFVATRLLRIDELHRILRFDRFEFGVAIITVLVVGFVGIEQGVVVAILLALAERIRLTARPRDAVLGREPGTDHWIPADIGYPTEQVPGVLVFLVYSPLWYGNINHVLARVREIVDAAPQPLHRFVLDANAISDIDYTGAMALARLVSDLEGRGISVAAARASHLVHHDLKRSGLLSDALANRLFQNVDGAVKAISDAKAGLDSTAQQGTGTAGQNPVIRPEEKP